MNLLKNKIENTSYVPIIALSLIAVIGLALRLLFFKTELLIRQDAISYLWFANDLVFLKHFPEIPLANIGWPLLLSIFFSVFHFDNFSDYSTLQQTISMIVSVLTVFPMYFLCRRFFSRSFSLIGASLLILEPHLILNSLRGLIEPWYIFLLVSSFALFLSSNKKFQYAAFAIATFSMIVRAEGSIIFLVFSIMFLKQHYKEGKKILLKIMFIGVIFLIIFVPISELKNQSSGTDGTADRIVSMSINSSNDDSFFQFANWVNALETLGKRLLQSMIPYFALFVPFGMILLFKERNQNRVTIILFMAIYLIAMLRVFTITSDIRLLFGLYPMFCILSVFSIKQLCDSSDYKNIFLILTVCGVLVLSWFFIFNNTEIEREIEVMQFSEYISDKVTASNNFFPESGYVYGAWASSNIQFPTLSSSVEYTGPELHVYQKDTVILLEDGADSIQEYIKLTRELGVTHLIVDNNNYNRAEFFTDLYYNEENYPYLIKEFDSFADGYKYYHVKVFKINFEKFDLANS